MALALHRITIPFIIRPLKRRHAGRHTKRTAKRTSSLARSSFYLMAATIVTSIFGYVFWTAAARLFPASAIGEAGAGVSAMSFASLVGAMGGAQALLAELPNKGRPEDWSSTVTTSLVFTAATSAVVALATVVVLAQTGHSRFLYHQAWWVAAFVIGVIATTASQLLENVWVAQRQAEWFLGASFVFSVVKLAIIVIPVVAVFGAVGILSIWSVVLAITVAGCLVMLGRMYGYRPRFTGFRAQLWSMRQTLTGNYAISVGDQITLYLIPVLVAIQVSPDAAGWFYAAWKIGAFYAVFASAVGTSTFAEGSRQPDRALSIATSGMRMILPFIALGTIVTILGGHLVLRAFGGAYAAHAYPLLVFLSVAAFPDAVVNIYRTVLRAQRRYVVASAMCWIISATRLALTWLAVARWGIVGAGWAWLLTQTGGAVWCVIDCAWYRGSTKMPDDVNLEVARPDLERRRSE